MRRYKRLTKEDFYEALNEVRDAFLAAKNGNEVDEIMSFMLTTEEKIKIGRRILIAKYLELDLTLDEIYRILKVGKSTVQFVTRRAHLHPLGLELIRKRKETLEEEYQKHKNKESGGSKLVFKNKNYTGLKRKDISR